MSVNNTKNIMPEEETVAATTEETATDATAMPAADDTAATDAPAA